MNFFLLVGEWVYNYIRYIKCIYHPTFFSFSCSYYIITAHSLQVVYRLFLNTLPKIASQSLILSLLLKLKVSYCFRYFLDPAIASTLSKTVNGNLESPKKPSAPSEQTYPVRALPAPATVHPHPTTLAFKPPSSQVSRTSRYVS